MAERVGFEPTSPFGRTAFRERRLKPTRQPLLFTELVALFFILEFSALRPTLSYIWFQRRHSRESGNPVQKHWIPGQARNDKKAGTSGALDWILRSPLLKKGPQDLSTFFFKNSSINLYPVIQTVIVQ